MPRHLKPTDVILDAGTGGGEKPLTFAPHVALAIGIDPDRAMIQAAWLNALERENVVFVTMGAEPWPFATERSTSSSRATCRSPSPRWCGG